MVLEVLTRFTIKHGEYFVHMYTIIANVATDNYYGIRVYEKSERRKNYKGRIIWGNGTIGDVSDFSTKKAGDILKAVFPEFPGYTVDTGFRRVSHDKFTKVLQGHILYWIAFLTLKT